MNLIINADDLGVTAGVNQAILLCMRRGIVSSTSLMVNQDGTDAAIQYLRSGLIPCTGVHLCISAGRPLLPSGRIPSLVDEHGFFHRPSRYAELDINPLDIEREFEAQIEKVLAGGVSISHLDTHHHIQRYPVVLEALITVAHRYDLPVRHLDPAMRERIRERGVATPDHFCGEWIGPAVSRENLYQMILGARDNGHQVVELMTHPGFADVALQTRSSYVGERQKELAILCAPETRDWLKSEGVTLCNYSVCRVR
ncbi:carbohydrate deacetylase [Candidatus Desulforudis audaxviator]|uniref:YdjC family protein n=1 Tax=Desulforudis audaxviator (strain MP104C) TaxID=477974 RepID=B1I408_DESAP|nr:carbohydrate deacetylase [Candidatus Desulforudis audaxviator]ACA59772.1 YdjC family protein [Candidatus Desulforudis audaxviator MP104C]AZK59772.1 Cellobiose phosphotransferase system YdjC-like protein [Candidatus Desulforudis audaxviator]